MPGTQAMVLVSVEIPDKFVDSLNTFEEYDELTEWIGQQAIDAFDKILVDMRAAR